MRFSLRWKILLIIALTPIALGLGAVVTVQHNVQQHVDSSSIHENLQQTVRVLESMLGVRGRALEGGAEVIARDPRFSSLLMLGLGQRDSRFEATVRGMARDFNLITKTEIFEVLDRRGRRLASAGSVSTNSGSRDALISEAYRGRVIVGVIVQDDLQYQVCATPVRADGRVVGVLLLGSEIGQRISGLLRSQMRSEITLVAHGRVLVSTLGRQADRDALAARLAPFRSHSDTDPRSLGVVSVRARDRNWLTVIRPLPGSAYNEGQFYVVQRSIDSEIDFLGRMHRDLVALAVVAVICALLTGLLLSEKILRPIQQLVQGAQEMERGNYTAPLIVTSRDEIGFLAERFQEMRQRERIYVSSLEEMARLKSEFITVASHELRTPISTIQGYSDLLTSGTFGELPEQQRRAIDAIRSCVVDLTKIAEQATLMSQVKGERLELKIDLHAIATIVERAIHAAVSSAPTRRVRVEAVAESTIENITADAEKLTLCISNLISNAIRFSRENGMVRVVTRDRDGHLEIAVIDQGEGIPGGDLEQLFEHGYAMRNPLHHHSSGSGEFGSSGLGMGLGIARGIIEAHGGTLTVKSELGRGSEFAIRLPRPTERDSHRAA
jgi:signal transduction histidine kinase